MPDEGGRVFSLSEGHGPSVLDLLGISVILIGWLAFLIPLVRSRASVWRPGWVLVAALAGGALLAWSLATDTGSWWMVGVVVLVAVQVVAALGAIRRETPRQGGGDSNN